MFRSNTSSRRTNYSTGRHCWTLAVYLFVVGEIIALRVYQLTRRRRRRRICIVGSAYTTVALTADRMVGVAFPLRWVSIFTRTRVKSILCIVLMLSMTLSIPNMLDNYIGEKWENNASIITSINDNFFPDAVDEIVYNHVSPILFIYIPLTLMCVLNIVIIVSLVNHRKQAAKLAMPSSTRSNNRTTGRITAQVLMISGFSITSGTVRCLYKQMYFADADCREFERIGRFEDCSVFIYTMFKVYLFFETINSTINFFFLLLFWKQVQTMLFQKFRWLGK